MRYFLTVMAFFSLVSAAQGAWSDIFQKEFLTPAREEKPRVEQSVCIQCHTSDLVKAAYKGIPGDWRKSWHYQNDVACQDCHGGDPKDAAKAMTRESGFVGCRNPKTCRNSAANATSASWKTTWKAATARP